MQNVNYYREIYSGLYVECKLFQRNNFPENFQIFSVPDFLLWAIFFSLETSLEMEGLSQAICKSNVVHEPYTRSYDFWLPTVEKT